MRHAKVRGRTQFIAATTISHGIIGFSDHRSFIEERDPGDYQARHHYDDWWAHRPRLCYVGRQGWFRQGNPWPTPEHTHGMNRWIN